MDPKFTSFRSLYPNMLYSSQRKGLLEPDAKWIWFQNASLNFVAKSPSLSLHPLLFFCWRISCCIQICWFPYSTCLGSKILDNHIQQYIFKSKGCQLITSAQQRTKLRHNTQNCLWYNSKGRRMHPYARKRRFGSPFRSFTMLRSLVAEGNEYDCCHS